MNYIVINSEYNGVQNGVNTFYASPIKSGEHIGKFATSENSLVDFPEIFEAITYETIELQPKVFKVDFTPPTLSPYAVEIPTIYQWAFPEDMFVLSGFIIPLDTYQNTKIVNIAYFQWAEFRAELDSGNYEALKRSLMPLWDYVAEQVSNGNVIVL